MEQLDKEAAEYKAMLADLDAEEKEQAIADGKKLRDDAEKKAAEEADKRKAEALEGKDENVSNALKDLPWLQFGQAETDLDDAEDVFGDEEVLS
mmetsp:Transcript_179/g.251  ORF Transcript_179/g.251 Transcript_179/m.251 type:complete len:94 (-) Transcript_179:99-380(-)